VALAAYAGSGISGSDPMKTSFTSFRLGIAAYIVPFMFFYAPEILLMGDLSITILRTVTALIGIYALAAAVQGWYFGEANLVMRLLLFITALSLISPSVWQDLVGLVILLVLFAVQKVAGLETKKAPQPDSVS